MDRIDIHVEVPAVRLQDLTGLARGESSSAIRERVVRAREVQQVRFRGNGRVTCNASMRAQDVQRYCALASDAGDLLRMAITDLNFSARAYERILKVARTVADLEGVATIGVGHISEAIQYRSLDRQWQG